MGVAVASGRVGYALLEGDYLVDWGISQVAARSCADFNGTVSRWISLLNPEVVVSETVDKSCRKRGTCLALLEALPNSLALHQKLHATVSRVHAYVDKYEEAKVLAEKFPDLRPHLAKKPKIWLNEPRRIIIFEALSLALQVQFEGIKQ